MYENSDKIINNLKKQNIYTFINLLYSFQASNSRFNSDLIDLISVFFLNFNFKLDELKLFLLTNNC